jgi:glucose/arabinose dehydrogenase
MKSGNLLYIFLFFMIWMQVNAQPQIELQLHASGLNAPVGIVSAGDSRLFILEQRGLVRIIDHEGNIMDPPFLDVSDVVSQSGFERGLLGLAFHPEFSENGYFYINYTREQMEPPLYHASLPIQPTKTLQTGTVKCNC